MPNASAGANIASTSQVVDGVIENADLANDTIEAGKIKAGAVGTSEVANDSIINEDIKSDAAIDDSKLAQINDADKVHGSALTNLDSIPSDAGIIPAANLPGGGKVIPAVTIASSITATELLNYTVPAGTLSTGNVIRFKIPIWDIRKAGTGNANAIYINFGGTNYSVINPDNNAATYNGDRGYIEGEIWGAGSTSAQGCLLKMEHGQDNNASAPTQWWTSSQDGAPAKDSTVNQTLKVMWQNGINSANDYIKTGVGVLEIIKV